MIEAYRERIGDLLDAVLEHELEAIGRAAGLVAGAVRAGGVVHLFGSGHSSLAAAEAVYRSGSLAPLNQIVDRTEDLAERIEGYGAALMAGYAQQYGLEAHDALIVISNSGRNPLPIEVALAARERGIGVVAVTNLSQSRALASRHGSGRRLFEVADVVLDTHAPAGEAALELPGSRQAAAPVSSFAALFLVNAVVLEAARSLEAGGAEAPLLRSENAADEDAARHNAALLERYRGRLRRFGV